MSRVLVKDLRPLVLWKVTNTFSMPKLWTGLYNRRGKRYTYNVPVLRGSWFISFRHCQYSRYNTMWTTPPQQISICIFGVPYHFYLENEFGKKFMHESRSTQSLLANPVALKPDMLEPFVPEKLYINPINNAYASLSNDQNGEEVIKVLDEIRVLQEERAKARNAGVSQWVTNWSNASNGTFTIR